MERTGVNEFAVVPLEYHGYPADAAAIYDLCREFSNQWGESLFASAVGCEWWFYVSATAAEDSWNEMRGFVSGYLAARDTTGAAREEERGDG